MSWFNRRTFLLSAIALGGCGFEPIYKTQSATRSLLSSIELDKPSDRDDYVMNRRLEERIGAALSPKFALSYSISTSSSRAAISTDGRANRQVTTGDVTYSLRRLSDGKIVKSGKEEAFVGSSTTGSTVATHAAERDARERLIIQLADNVVDSLALLKPQELE